MPRPKEYSRRAVYTSSMDAELLESIREICRIHRFEMNTLWEEKALEVRERYSQGLPVKKEAIMKAEVPTILSLMDDIKRWVTTQATPEEATKAMNIMRAAAGWIKDSEKSIKTNYQLRQEGKLKVSPSA